jgi:hypothetical protein
MELDLDRVRSNAKEAETEDLLDRVTVFRGGMDEEALPVLEAELRSRDIGEDQVQAHFESLELVVMWERPGLAYRCAFCERPATQQEWRWHRLLGLIPIFPRLVFCCPAH